MDADTIISLQHVRKEFDNGDFVAVEDFTLDIKKGEFVTLLGPSGCGKSTTLRMIAGFDIPSKGKILLNGKDITTLPPYKRPINTVFQHYALFPYLDVYDNVAFGLKLKKVPVTFTNKKGEKVTKLKHLSAKEIDERVAKALEIVDLSEMEDRNISTLSGGQQQRVAIARAIVLEPQVLLLDEPLSALDHKMRKDMQIELKDMHNKLGITFIYVTHDQEEALTMSDTIVVMSDGEIQQIGTPESIYNEPVNAYVADFIGESNIYNGTMIDKQKVLFLGAKWDCVDDFLLNEKVDVVIRPEDVICSEEKGNIAGVITSAVFKGEDYSYVIEIGKAEMTCRDHKARKVGTKVFISVDKENIQVMHKDVSTNIWGESYIDKNGNVYIGSVPFEADLTKILKDSVINEDGYLYDSRTKKKYDLTDAEIVLSCPFDAVSMSDDLSNGKAQGQIISSVYKGDHYQYIVRTEEEEDYIINSPYEWNLGDVVSVDIPKDSFKIKLKKDISNYEIND